jgi:adenylate cyclase
MALFSDWTGRADHADAAVDAGREMLARLDRINAAIAAEGQAPLAIGIGIHTGPAVVGSVGSPRRMEFTAIGDTVNVASRVEGLTKTVGEPLLLTAATRAALRSHPPVTELPPQPVKGQPEPVVVFGLGKPAATT